MSIAERIAGIWENPNLPITEGTRGYYGSMLGKRKRQFQYKSRKLTAAKMDIRQAQPYGKGYNPKRISLRKPPPNGEVKFHDNGAPYTTLANVSTTTTPPYSQIDSFCLIPQGDLNHQRNGAKIMLSKLTFRFGVMIDTNSNAAFGSVVQTSSTWRVILYIDTQTNGAAAGIGDVFDASIANEHAFDIYNNLYNTGRFKTLMDKYINLDGIAPTWDGSKYIQAGQMKEFKKTFALNLPVTYTGTDGTIGTIRTNNIGCFVFCNSFGGTSDATQRKFAYRFRLRFTDY